MSQHEQTESVNINQEIDQQGPDLEDATSSQFIVKRTEESDISYFMDPILKNQESSKPILEYNSFFNIEDIYVGYENSEFSITIIDQKENNAIAGIFIFNITPFAPIKRDNLDQNLIQCPGLWEEWFQNNFDETKVDGKNTLWLIYFCLDPKYTKDEDILQKIFLKIWYNSLSL